MKKQKWSIIFLFLLLCGCSTVNETDSELSENVQSGFRSIVSTIVKSQASAFGTEAKTGLTVDSLKEDLAIQRKDDVSTEEMSEAMDYLCQEVPEMDDYMFHITKRSDGRAHYELIYVTFSEGYYHFSVGERWDDGHRVTWDFFSVSKELDEVLWNNIYCSDELIILDEYLTLDEWRETDFYKSRMEKLEKR